MSAGPNPRLVHFSAGLGELPAGDGVWRVREPRDFIGEGLAPADWLGMAPQPVPGAIWQLRGTTSNERYATADEKGRLGAVQEGLGRPAARWATLIPIRKSAAWWALPQDRRRAIFEAQSQHTAIGLRYLPAIARRLHHCRDLAEAEPFDFLTWFEYAPQDEPAFDALLAELRASAEWAFVERECELRVARGDAV